MTIPFSLSLSLALDRIILQLEQLHPTPRRSALRRTKARLERGVPACKAVAR